MKRTLVLVCLFAVGGCSSGSFVGKRFDNFTAYYNTFYNARKAYNEAVKAMEQPNKAVDRTTYLLVFDTGARGSGTRDFENAIKKSADVLRGHPDSKWVDDALLLIGKSYYQMGNTVGAQQKFSEVIDRASGLEDEARFWMGLAMIASGSLDAASAHLQASIDREKVSRKWRARMRLALGELYVRQERWEEAAEQLGEGTRHADDDDLGGRAQFLLGQVLETLGDYQGAARAYRDVERFNPRYELSYAAKFSAVRVEGEYGDPDEALAALRKMSRDDKNFAYRAELEYLRGRILKADRRREEALSTFYDVLYDPDGNIGSIRGPVHYHLGLLLRDQFVDFDLAAAHFDTAATALGRGSRPNTSGRTETLAPAPYAITDAGDLAEVFGNYSRFHAEVLHYDSLLALGTLDEEAFRERIEEIRRQRAEELVEERRDQARRAAEAGFRGGATDIGRTQPRGGAGGDDYATAGFLYHRDRSRVQDGLLAFFDRWGERPLVPNWRRLAAIASGPGSGSTRTGDEPGDRAQVATPVSGDVTTEALLGSVEVDISEIPRTAEGQAEMRRQRASARYELANVLFLSIGLPDSAAVWYRRVLDEAQDAEIRARALYALAEVQQSLGDEESAAAIYRQVLDEYPESEVASRSAQRLGIGGPASVASGVDEISRRYQAAFDQWVTGAFERGMRGMLSVAADYPDTVASGRALLAAGAIYVDWAEMRGRDILEPLSVPVPDSIWVRLGLVETSAPSGTLDARNPAADSAAANPAGPDTGMQKPLADTGAESGAAPDSTLAAAASSAAIPAADSVVTVPADSTRGGLITGGDTLSVEQTLEAPQGARRAPSTDTLRQAVTDEPEITGEGEREPPDIHLIDIYRLVNTRYPGSEYASRASQLAAAIEERLEERKARDSLAVADPVVVAADSVSFPAPDSTAIRITGDAPPTPVTRLAADSTADAAATGTPTVNAPADSLAERGTGPVRRPELPDRPDLRAEDLLVPGPPGNAPAASDTTVYEAADSVPVLVGGEGALQRMFRYPETAAEGGVTGRVELSFEVDQRGRVVAPVVASAVGAGCDEEAQRVIRLSRYRPATIDGLPVRFRMSAHVDCAPRSEP